MQKVNLEDSILIERSQKGDRAAFDQLLQKHTERAYQYAHRLTRLPEEASDIVAEAFVRICKALATFKGESAFTTWLYRIETNCFLDMRKKQRSRPCTSLDAALQTADGELALQIEDDAPSPYIETERRERMTAIEKAVADLPEYQRAMIVLYHGEMLSYEDIAETLHLPIGTVKSRLNRARISLRERLSPNEMFAGELQTA
jgi:RNA polymerase sigma-70 factor (ECF subfamily)